MRFAFRPLVALIVLLISASPLLVEAAHPEASKGRGGAVSCAAPGARDAGLEVLAAGGNAVDAAVATALALAVVHPNAGNLGGGGFAVIRVDGQVETIDFREVAPAAAFREMYLDKSGEPIREASLVGPLAAGVPGSPHGLYGLHERHGRLEWKRVVAPAIRLAEAGFEVTPRLHGSLVKAAELLARFPETAEVWLPDGQAPAVGSTMRIPVLAGTLKAYAEMGPKAIMDGEAATAIEAASTKYGGVLRASDLRAYRPVWREPVRFQAFGWEVASMSLPSSGGIILGQTCGLLERLKWKDLPRFGADRAHLLAEVWRLSFADRYQLGDPKSTRATPEDLLAAEWLDQRAAQISRLKTTPSDLVRSWTRDAGKESPETTHLSTVDGDGNIVSMTTTINGNFGCGLVVPELGFLLNNEMDDFAAAPGRPNLFGLIQGEANAVAAGHRMLSSMTPTVAWRDGEVFAIGAPGGSTIPTSTAQVFLNLVVDEDHLQAAVNRPRMHHQWLPDAIAVEEDLLSPETRTELEKRGHEIRLRRKLGEVCAVKWTAGGEVQAAADPRGPGAAGIVNPAF